MLTNEIIFNHIKIDVIAYQRGKISELPETSGICSPFQNFNEQK